MIKPFGLLLASSIMSIMLSGCGTGTDTSTKGGTSSRENLVEIVKGERRGIYYWKSLFSLSPSDTTFLRDHRITHLYLKMFDVAPDKDWDTGEVDVFPVATTRFKSAVPEGVEVVPTVYITLEALQRSAGKEEALADKIVARVLAMASFNELGTIHEVQFDCDWTESTEMGYNHLCRRARTLLKEKEIILSGTVRLHQVRDGWYPFDRAVVMVYNTGSIKNISTRNSILDHSDVETYIKPGERTKGFLSCRAWNCSSVDFAYPDFGWGVWFRGDKFMGLLHTTDFSDEKNFVLSDVNIYKVTRNIEIEGHLLMKGDQVRLETAGMQEILMSKARVESVLGKVPHSNIIYHLDSLSLSHFSDHEIENIYSL